MSRNDNEGDIVWDVVTAVAETKGVEAIDLEESLGSVIDTDALEELIEGMSSGEITFKFSGCVITVTHDGKISIRNPTTPRSC